MLPIALAGFFPDRGEKHRRETTPNERHDHDHGDPSRCGHGRFLRLTGGQMISFKALLADRTTHPAGCENGPRKMVERG